MAMSLGAGHQSAPWFPSNCSATQIFDGCLTGCPGLVEAGQDASGHETASCVPACLVLVLGSLSLVSLWTLPWPIVAIARQRLLTDGPPDVLLGQCSASGNIFWGIFQTPGNDVHTQNQNATCNPRQPPDWRPQPFLLMHVHGCKPQRFQRSWCQKLCIDRKTF